MSNTEQSLKIFGIIAQIEQMVENAPRPKLGGNVKRIVDADEIFDLLGDLKVVIPEDFRRANNVLIESDTIYETASENAAEIVEQANKEAENIRQQADAYTEDMRAKAERDFEARVAEHEVYTEALRRADQLQALAEENAEIVFTGAKQYADDILSDLERYLGEYQNMVQGNRAELGVTANNNMQRIQHSQQQPNQEADVPASAPTAYQEDFSDEQSQRHARKRGWLGRKRQEDDAFFDDAGDRANQANDDDWDDESAGPRAHKKRRNRGAEMDIDLDAD
jgi:hypothetical protein